MPSNEISFRVETMRRRLSSRCKGLLEVAWSLSDSHFIVKYLHRTVKDYLCQTDIWRYILSGAEPLNPDLILAGTFLHAVKVMTLSPETFEAFWQYFNLCVHHSLSLDSTETHLEFVDELKRTGDTLFASQIFPPRLPHWTATCCPESRYGRLFQTFFGFAFSYPLHSYVQRELAASQLPNSPTFEEGRSQLYYAAILYDIKILDIVFDAGGDPNHPETNLSDWTPWSEILQVMQYHKDSYHYWAQVAYNFPDHGADPHAYAANSKLTITDLIEQRFGEWEPIKIRELLEKWRQQKRFSRS